MEDYIKTWCSPFCFGSIFLFKWTKQCFLYTCKMEICLLWEWALLFAEDRLLGDTLFVQCCQSCPDSSGEIFLEDFNSNFQPLCTIQNYLCVDWCIIYKIEQKGFLNTPWVIFCFSTISALTPALFDALFLIALLCWLTTNSDMCVSVCVCVCVLDCLRNLVEPVITRENDCRNTVPSVESCTAQSVRYLLA